MTQNAISETTTHDLWVEARLFDLKLTRPTPTTLQLDITRPTGQEVVDGAVIVIDTKALTAQSFPGDGDRYVGSTNVSAPADLIGPSQVVAFYSGILNQPIPAGTLSADGKTTTFSITLTGADADTIYYASIHPSTNVLQYYPIGVQSYPLESSRIEKDNSTYTGNIPTLPAPPTNPAPGQVYFDSTLNVVQYWDQVFQAWIPTRVDLILSGNQHPGVIGQVYSWSSEAELRGFDGVAWVKLSASTLSVRVGLSFVPFTGTFSRNTTFPETPVIGDFFYSYVSMRVFYWDGVDWIPPGPTNTLLQTGLGPVPAFTVPFSIEALDLPTPYRGLLFYNSHTKTLDAWNGSAWVQANTDQAGTPSTDKVAIGNDGSYDERVRLIRVLQAQLGYPVQCVELTEEQFNVAIDNALDTYRQLSDGAYRQAYILLSVKADQQLYYLNSPLDGTDRVVSINKIHRLNILAGNSMTSDNNIYYQTFLNQYYSAGYADILSIQLLHMLSEEFNRIFAGDLMFVWDEPSRELQVLRRLAYNEKVILECLLERSEQELFSDRWCKQFLQNWALAELKEYLGLIRSKYSSGTPGPAGTITLNGELLIAEARQDMTELKEALLNYEYGGHAGSNVSFLMG